jgi:hypothetical protein
MTVLSEISGVLGASRRLPPVGEYVLPTRGPGPLLARTQMRNYEMSGPTPYNNKDVATQVLELAKQSESDTYQSLIIN